VLHHIRHWVGPGQAAVLPDDQLLDRFVVGREEAAFEVLVRRYGVMVLAVGRRVLGAVHAAEDVFQATFLTLARKAASLDRRKPLGSWLYTVAYRLALRARTSEARRRACERNAAQSRPEAVAIAQRQDLCLVLDEELQRLPEKYRAPLVLC